MQSSGKNTKTMINQEPLDQFSQNWFLKNLLA